MKKKEKENSIWDLRFWLICLCGYSAGYLMFRDRVSSFAEIGNMNLLLLVGPFILGCVYKHDIFVVLFWLFLGLGGTDIVVGMGKVGPDATYWGGFVVWFLAGLSGLTGWAFSTLIQIKPKPIKSRMVRLR